MKSKNPFTYRVTVAVGSDPPGILSWLIKQWGSGGYQKTSHWTLLDDSNDNDHITIRFRSEQDAAFFKLRWA